MLKHADDVVDVFSTFPTIKLSNGMSLRQPEASAEDATNYFNYCQNPSISKFITDECIPRSINEALSTMRYIRNTFINRESVFWVIANEKNQLIGTIGCFNTNYTHRKTEISYELSQEYWGRGIMTECLTKVLEFLFEKLELYRVEATTVKYNIPSQRLLQKCGFSHEGTLAQYKFYKGESIDIMIFGYSSRQYFADINLAQQSKFRNPYVNINSYKKQGDSINLNSLITQKPAHRNFGNNSISDENYIADNEYLNEYSFYDAEYDYGYRGSLAQNINQNIGGKKSASTIKGD